MPDSPTDFESYIKARQQGLTSGPSMEEAEAGLKIFLENGGDSEFDGGDSGGGVVGDGNTDLEDQHNSPTLGALRGGVSEAGGLGASIGRGRVEGATNARAASAGGNYFGRDTGYANEKLKQVTEESIRSGKLDAVRAQQFENWFNQRAIHKQNTAQGQGVVFGERKEGGHYIAREALSSQTWRQGGEATEISQRDLAKHLDSLREAPAGRLDGEAWDALSYGGAELVDTFELKTQAGSTTVKDIRVKNQLNTFAPFQAGFAPGSSDAFQVTPNAGTMNRRSGEPIELTVRFTPKVYGEPVVATLIFETEDFKHAYQFIGST
uniref:Uncharacterized protein n=1 Tax=Coccolithus braarudii TaxID=221442 RepID=A0A7S0Q865_9EUKA